MKYLRRLALRVATRLLDYADDDGHTYVIVCAECSMQAQYLVFLSGFQAGERKGFEKARKALSPVVGEA